MFIKLTTIDRIGNQLRKNKCYINIDHLVSFWASDGSDYWTTTVFLSTNQLFKVEEDAVTIARIIADKERRNG